MMVLLGLWEAMIKGNVGRSVDRKEGNEFVSMVGGKERRKRRKEEG